MMRKSGKPGRRARQKVIRQQSIPEQESLHKTLARASALPMRVLLALGTAAGTTTGDAVDVALLMMAHEAGVISRKSRIPIPGLPEYPSNQASVLRHPSSGAGWDDSLCQRLSEDPEDEQPDGNS